MDPEIPKEETNFSVVAVSPYSQKPKSCFFYFAQLTLRIMVIAFTLAAAILMVKSHQSVDYYGIILEARYSYSSSFRFKVIADSTVCGLSLLSVILVISLNRPKSNPKNYFYLLLHDMVSLLVLLSGCSAAMAIGFVGRFGLTQTGWMGICDRATKFCDKIMASILSSFVAIICLFVLTIMSAHKLKTQPYLAGT